MALNFPESLRMDWNLFRIDLIRHERDLMTCFALEIALYRSESLEN